MASTPAFAHADPSKRFFVEMLTRDITIMDCLLDLVDNAVDKAVKRAGLDVMLVLEGMPLDAAVDDAVIDMDLSPDRFEIRDTCGGISIEEAENHVFLFGSSDGKDSALGLSVYGIGMKRAIFKLGNLCDVRSETPSEYFRVHIDVPEWEQKKDWNFPFVEAGRVSETKGSGPPGTTITVTALHESVKQRFGQPGFERELRDKLSATYALFLTAGVQVRVNGKKIDGRLPRIAGESVQTARKQFNFAGVDVLLLAGVAPPEESWPHGNYVFCNGRMVVEADRSPLTGWGELFPQFHTKYNSFVGYMYFQSDDVYALPWRTTKQGVEKDSPVFQQALTEMRVYGNEILGFLSKLYPNEVTPDVLLKREVLEKSSSVSISSIPIGDRPFSVRAISAQESKYTWIQYQRAKADLDRIRRHLGKRSMSASKIGEYTFDYFLEQELG